MRKYAKVAIAVVAPLLIVASVYTLANSPAAGQQPAGVEEISAPDQWVPFSATVLRLKAGKETNVAGKLYRASDGSRRMESGPPGDRQAVISINNFTDQTTYMFAREIGWSARPLLLRNSLRPPKLRVDNAKVFRHAEMIENFEVLRMTGADGEATLIAPALNGEALVRQSMNGTRLTLTEIVLGEQPAELFQPPAGAIMGKPIDLSPHLAPKQ